MTRHLRVLLLAFISVGGLLASGPVLGAPHEVAAGAASPTAGGGTYTVRRGDYLFGIARRLGVPVRSLLAANGLTLTSVIHPGQQLHVPAAAPAASPTAGGGTYTVRRGDYLFGIARRVGVPVRSLLAANGLTLTSLIVPGQQLQVPAPGGAAAPATATPTPTPPPPTPTPPTSAAVVERTIRDAWPDGLEATALAIAWRESRYQPNAQSRCCAGLFQLYYDVHKGWLAALGIDSRDDLYDARTNAEAAFALYQRAGGWSPWSLANA